MTPSVRIVAAGVTSVVGTFSARNPAVIPAGFDKVCKQMKWDTREMWLKLSDQRLQWYEAANGAYVYRNVQDGQWWIDEPGGMGVYVAPSKSEMPPMAGWQPLQGAAAPLPTLEVTHD